MHKSIPTSSSFSLPFVSGVENIPLKKKKKKKLNLFFVCHEGVIYDDGIRLEFKFEISSDLINMNSSINKTSIILHAGYYRIWPVLCGYVVVRQEKGSSYHSSIQPPRSDNGSHDRYPHPTRATSSWEVIYSLTFITSYIYI